MIKETTFIVTVVATGVFLGQTSFHLFWEFFGQSWFALLVWGS